MLIDFGAVYSNAVKEADKWLEMMGKALSENARNKLNKTLKTIKDLESELGFFRSQGLGGNIHNKKLQGRARLQLY